MSSGSDVMWVEVYNASHVPGSDSGIFHMVGAAMCFFVWLYDGVRGRRMGKLSHVIVVSSVVFAVVGWVSYHKYSHDLKEGLERCVISEGVVEVLHRQRADGRQGTERIRIGITEVWIDLHQGPGYALPLSAGGELGDGTYARVCVHGHRAMRVWLRSPPN